MKRVFANVPLTENGQLLVNLGLIRIDGRVQRYWAGWITWMEANGWRLYDWYVWDQASGLPGYYAGHLLPSHEWVFHLNKQPVDCQKIVDCLHAGETRSGSGMRNPDGTVGKYSQDSVTIQNKKVPDSVIRIRRQVGRIGKDIDHPAVFPPAYRNLCTRSGLNRARLSLNRFPVLAQASLPRSVPAGLPAQSRLLRPMWMCR